MPSAPASPSSRRPARQARIGLLLAMMAAATLGGVRTSTAEPAGNPARAEDAQAIHAAAQAYQEALRRGDTKALAELWTPDGDIVDDLGQVLPGRDTVAIPAANPSAARPDIRVTEQSLRFLSADVAVEDGMVAVTLPGGSLPLEGRFSATWVRHEGGWKLAALREARNPPTTGPEALKDLEWMVGDWTVVDEPATAPDGTTPAAHPAPALPARAPHNQSPLPRYPSSFSLFSIRRDAHAP